MMRTPILPPELLQKILEALDILQLPELGRALQAALDSPSANDDRLLWLWRLLEPQMRQRLEGRIERRIRQSRLPERKTFEAFDSPSSPASIAISSWSSPRCASSSRARTCSSPG
jgi:hypothetical protein